MTLILGIDPGERTSGYVLLDTEAWRVLRSESAVGNYSLCASLETLAENIERVVCEKPAAMGQPLSGNLVETTIWAGVFWHAAKRRDWHWLTRNQVKVALVGKCQGVKDAHVACAAQERFGGRKVAVGTKREPGPCYGVSGHAWQALAVALAWWELKQAEATT